MLRTNLLIEKTAANKHSNFFLRIIHNICKIQLTLRYFLYIYIPYQMYAMWSCVKFYYSLNRFPQANVDRISTSWKWLDVEVYTKSIWFHFELNLSSFSRFLWKKPCKKTFSQKLFWQTGKILNIFKNVPEKNSKISKPFELF